jgi:hypothetical protein
MQPFEKFPSTIILNYAPIFRKIFISFIVVSVDSHQNDFVDCCIFLLNFLWQSYLLVFSALHSWSLARKDKQPIFIYVWELLQLHLHPLIRYCCISNKNSSDLIFAWSWFDVFDVLIRWQIYPISVKHNKNMGFDIIIIARKRKGAEKWKLSKMFVEKVTGKNSSLFV